MSALVSTFIHPTRLLAGVLILTAAAAGCARYAAPDVLETAPPNPPAFAPVVPTTAEAVPARTDRVTVEEAVSRVLGRNPVMRAAFERVCAADATRVQALAWRNPELEVEAEGVGGDRSGFDGTQVTLSLGLPLEVFGTRGLRAGVAEAGVSVERSRYQETRHGLIERTWMAFHRVLAARERVRISRSRVDVTIQTTETMAARVEAGQAAPLERVRAEVGSQTARAAQESALAEYRTAREELAALWAQTGADSLVVEGELRSRTRAIDRNQLAAEIMERHPTLLAARWKAERERRAGQLLSRQRWPDLRAGAGIRWNRETDTQDFVGGIGIEIPIFDRAGGARRAASRRGEAAAHEVAAFNVQLAVELHTLLEELAARERALAVYANDIVPRATEALELARVGYERGKFGALDLLDAQRTVIDVEEGRAEALIAYDRALVRLESLLGRRLDDKTLEETQ